MFETVVIGWDGRPAADDALAWAVHRGLAYRYRVLRVVDDRDAVAGDLSPMSAEAAAEQQVLAKVAQVGRSQPALRIAGAVAVGDPMAELERYTGPGALLVLGSDRQTAAAPRWAWTAAARVAAHAHGPVVVVPRGCRHRDGYVLVGVDGTPASRTAALRAGELASTIGERLVVLHAWQAAGEPDVVEDGALLRRPEAGAPADDSDGTLERAHGALLHSVVDAVRAVHPELRIDARLVHASAPHAVLEAAEGAAVLVLGRHSRWSSSAALLGSVTHAMLLARPAPVLVVGRRDAPLPAERVRVSVRDAGTGGARVIG